MHGQRVGEDRKIAGQKCKNQFVFRSDTVKTDSGSYAVFKEQGSSAPQMTVAKDLLYV